MAQCMGVTKTGTRCRNNAIPGTNYCYDSSHGSAHKHPADRLRNWFVNNWLGVVGLGFGIITLIRATTNCCKGTRAPNSFMHLV
jgi:hypothetical protein